MSLPWAVWPMENKGPTNWGYVVCRCLKSWMMLLMKKKPPISPISQILLSSGFWKSFDLRNCSTFAMKSEINEGVSIWLVFGCFVDFMLFL